MSDGWIGVRDGAFRGERLERCLMHGGWWTPLQPCPACQLQAENEQLKARAVALEAELNRRCAECQKKPVNGREVTS